MAITTTKPIYPANAHLTRQVIEEYNPATNEYEPYTGASFVVSFAENADGTEPITGLQNLALAESGGEAGTYYRVITAAELAPIAALSGQVIYQIVTGGAYNGLRVVTPMRVSIPRYAQ